MARYIKKPIEVEAFQYYYGDSESGFPDWMKEAIKRGDVVEESGKIKIKTIEGNMTVSQGDYIVKGIQEELYPCKPDIFLSTYEQA